MHNSGSRMYIGYIQFFMLGLVLFKSFEDTRIGSLVFDYLIFSIPILFIIFIFLSLVLGRLDTIYGFREEELRNSSESNPVMREILMKLDAINTELAELKSKSDETDT